MSGLSFDNDSLSKKRGNLIKTNKEEVPVDSDNETGAIEHIVTLIKKPNFCKPQGKIYRQIKRNTLCEEEDIGLPKRTTTIDIDEISSLLTLASSSNTSVSVVSIPQNGIAGVGIGFGSYLSLSGLYNGVLNLLEGSESIQRLRGALLMYTEKLDMLEKNKEISEIELRNLRVYIEVLQHAIKHERTQKWAEGVAPLIACTTNIAGFFFIPLNTFSLLLITGCVAGQVVKYSCDLHTLNKLDISKLENISISYIKDGKEIFLGRVKDKKTFYKKLIAGWSVYSGGTSTLAGLSIVNVFGNPPALLISLGCALMVMGLGVAIYTSTKRGVKFLKKDTDKIKRQYIGGPEEILAQIAKVNKHYIAMVEVKEKMRKNLKKEMPLKNLNIYFKKVACNTMRILTLGVLSRVEEWKERTRKGFACAQEMPKLKELTSSLRNEYFNKFLACEMEFLEFLKLYIKHIEESFIKGLLEQSASKQALDINKDVREIFLEALEETIIKIGKTKCKIENLIENFSEIEEFETTWEFVEQNNMVGNVLGKVYRKLDKKFLELRNKFIEVKECIDDNYGGKHQHYIFKKGKLLKGMVNKDPDAEKLKQIIYGKINYIIIYDLMNEMQHRESELCEHLEDVLKKIKV